MLVLSPSPNLTTAARSDAAGGRGRLGFVLGAIDQAATRVVAVPSPKYTSSGLR